MGSWVPSWGLMDWVPLRAALVPSDLGRALATAALVQARDGAGAPRRRHPPRLRRQRLHARHPGADTPRGAHQGQRREPRRQPDGQDRRAGAGGPAADRARAAIGVPRRRPRSRRSRRRSCSPGRATWGRGPTPRPRATTGVRAVPAALRIVRARPPLGIAVRPTSAGFFALSFYDALIRLPTCRPGHRERVFGAAIAAVGDGGRPPARAGPSGAWGQAAGPGSGVGGRVDPHRGVPGEGPRGRRAPGEGSGDAPGVLGLPAEHRDHPRTASPVERVLAAVRHRAAHERGAVAGHPRD